VVSLGPPPGTQVGDLTDRVTAMSKDTSGLDRRTVLKTAGASGVTASMAGCSAIFGGGDEDTTTNVGDGDGGDGDGTDGDGTDGGTTDGEGQVGSDPLNAGLLTFTQGAAAVLGLQAQRGAELAVQHVNSNGGIAGQRQLNLDVVDEGSNPLDKYNSFIDEGKDVTFGPISSGTHQSLAPEVESNEVVNVGTDGTVTSLYEDTVTDPTYSFRFQNYDIMETTTAALEVVNRVGPENIDTVAGVNPGYAFGEDEQTLFAQAIQKLTGADIVYEGLPDLGASDYATHISEINSREPDVLFSSLWGGDVNTFFEQAFSRGMFENIGVTIGTVYYGSADETPQQVLDGVEDGKILSGSRNYYWGHPDVQNSAASQSLFDEATSMDGIRVPTAHFMSGYGAVMSWATAVEKAIDILGEYPSQEGIAASLEEHGFYTPGGYYNVCQDHQGRGNGFAGVMTWDSDLGAPVLADTNAYSATQISPPPQGSRYEVSASDWIASWG
jgi:branched-chain amino acid transport system substrate-binding protein